MAIHIWHSEGQTRNHAKIQQAASSVLLVTEQFSLDKMIRAMIHMEMYRP